MRRPADVARGIGYSLAIPHLQHSLDHLARIKGPDGKPLPAVIHPSEQQRPGRERFALDYLSFRAKHDMPLRHQPTAETLYKWGLLSANTRLMARGMLMVQEKYGIDGVAWDTAHGAETRYGDRRFRIHDPLAMVAELGRQCGLQELQINLTAEQNVMGILENGLERTQHGDMLAAAVGTLATGEPLLIVVEVDPSQIKGSMGEGHRRLVGIITDMLPAAG